MLRTLEEDEFLLPLDAEEDVVDHLLVGVLVRRGVHQDVLPKAGLFF